MNVQAEVSNACPAEPHPRTDRAPTPGESASSGTGPQVGMDQRTCRLRETQALAHPNCVVCAPSSTIGLGLVFRVAEDGGVEADFDCPRQFEGYAEVLHGGVVASVLDGAMTNCLFAYGLVAVTADLKIRFRHQVHTDVPATVRARIEESHGTLHLVRAELAQDNQAKVIASGRFVEHPGVVGCSGAPA